VHLLSSSWVPKALLEQIDIYCRRFLRSKDGEGHGLVLAAWKELCRSRAEGELGSKLMRHFHEALTRKQLAKLFEKPLFTLGMYHSSQVQPINECLGHKSHGDLLHKLGERWLLVVTLFGEG